MSESTISLSESDELAREEKRECRMHLVKRVAVVSFVVCLLLVLLFGAYDYTYTCRIRIPSGTTVVERSAVREHAGYLDFIFKSARFEKLRPYLLYRHYVIPSGATDIGAGAFDHCTQLCSVRIPYGVTKIGNYAFGSCLNLREIRIPDSVETIYVSAFYNTGLRKIVIPDSVTIIGYSAFSGCTSLETVVLRDGLKEIQQGAFENCTVLKKIVIPSSVEYIGYQAFHGCSALTDVELPPGVKVAPDVFEGTLVPPEKRTSPERTQTQP